MIELLKILGTVAIGSFTIVGLIGYLSKSLFEKYLDSKLEEHKHSLELITIEHEIRFAELHKERANLIKDFYSKIHEFKMSISVFIKYVEKGDNTESLRTLKVWGVNTAELSVLYERHRIYFSEESCKMIDKLFTEIKSVNEKLMVVLRDYTVADIFANKDSKKKEFLDLTDETKSILATKFESVKKDLEKEFRKLLGVK